MSENFFNDTKNELIVQTPFGADLNYAPFSTLYADIMEKLDDSSEIDESLYMKTLTKLGVIERVKGKTRPPLAVYDRMKGEEGADKDGFYCKKKSIISKTYTENFGICLDNLPSFRDTYDASIISMLNDLNSKIVEERAETDELEQNARDKKGRGNYGSIKKKYNAMFTSGKASIIDSFFKGVPNE